jgi:hypothetical protein
MNNILSYHQFINEAVQTTAGREFEELIGGILKNTDIIQDVQVEDGVMTLIPNGKLGKIDVSLIVGLLQDSSNVNKIKNQFKGVKSIRFEKMTLDIR